MSGPYAGFTKGGLHFNPVHIHLSSHMHAITITQVIIEGFILFKHNMPLISGHVTYIHIFIEFNNIYYAESNSKIVADSILRGCFVIKILHTLSMSIVPL